MCPFVPPNIIIKLLEVRVYHNVTEALLQVSGGGAPREKEGGMGNYGNGYADEFSFP